MKKMFKKISAIMICMLLVATMIPAVNVSAEDAAGTRFIYEQTLTEDGQEYSIDWYVELYRNDLTETLLAEIYIVSFGSRAPKHLIIPETVINPRNNTSYVVGVLGDGDEVAAGLISNDSIIEITIPNTVTKVGEYAFSMCGNLTKINGAENVNVWGAYSIAYCDELTEFEFKGNVDTVPEGMFKYCSSLVSVKLAPTIHTIETDAFGNCENLRSVLTTRGADMTSLHGFAFRGSIYAKIYAPETSALHDSVTVVGTVPLVMLENGITTSFSATDIVYDGETHQPTLTVKSSETQNEVDSGNYTLSYYRGSEETTDFISAGTIKVVIEGDIYKGTYGTGTATYDILPRDGLFVIARDKSVEDGESATGTATDVIYWGLLESDTIESVELSADGDALVPSDVVIKNGEIDVSGSYIITYVNGRSFTEKSIEGFVKTTEGNVDTYTITFGDGTVETIVITNGVDGVDGVDGATGAQGPQGEKGDTGEAGAQGIQGEKGDTGETGAQGTQGEKGEKGDTGETGAQGIQGEKGEKGDVGATGAQGAQGEKGDTNENGIATITYVSLGVGGVSLAGMIALLVILLKKKII